MEASLKGGKYLDIQGKELGSHEGYPFYTIGQRKGLGVHFGEPMFVTEIIPDKNIVAGLATICGCEGCLVLEDSAIVKFSCQYQTFSGPNRCGFAPNHGVIAIKPGFRATFLPQSRWR